MSRDRLIVGITGATGIIYGVRALQALRDAGVESHLVVSKAGEMTRDYETDLSRQDLMDMADVVHPIGDVGASIASGSFRTLGMLVAPCSVRTLAEVATGVTTTLLTRAADACLKERRRLVMMVREAPLSLIHIRNMAAVTEMGGIIHPPVPAFYTHPRSVEDIVDHALGRALDCFGIEMPDMPRWTGENRRGRDAADASPVIPLRQDGQ
ncbi:UbiX family flavin prenyltransferase [Mangrovicoccus sp. HB161399]|uniref:UbiX family flavin prenyltransferase n=1 Tax=Mangrovicoccus sp. HB161399 TaxID=2720392 RepID=UPI001552E899|nr:UbiX family flavin prenyltransferase [Mangrovicoccus sp. HB161399]